MLCASVQRWQRSSVDEGGEIWLVCEMPVIKNSTPYLFFNTDSVNNLRQMFYKMLYVDRLALVHG